MLTKSQLGPIGIFLLAVVPIIMWAGMRSLTARFGSYEAVMISLAQLSGLTGMTLFALVLILGARIGWLEDYFGGLNRMYVMHHLLGGLTFTLLLLHPLFTAAVLMPVSWAQAAFSIWPLRSGTLMFGWAALGLLVILLIMTFYFRPGYQIWKMTHKFLGAAFFLGGIHAFLTPSDMAQNWLLRGYILSLSAVALGFYVRHSILNTHRKYRYKVARQAEKLNEAVWRIVMEAEGRAMQYRAGQFAWFRFLQAGVPGESHPFTFSSGTSAGQLEITVKNLGDFSQTLEKIKPGTEVEVQGPYGRFNFQKGRFYRQLWIGGGVGITPFLGMGQDLKLDGSQKYNVHLIFAVRNQDEAFALTNLSQMEKEAGERLQVTMWHSDQQGYLTGKKIKDFLNNSLHETSFFICGPKPMMMTLKKQLIKEGVAKKDIHTEEFEL